MNTATRTSNIAEMIPFYTQIAFCTTPSFSTMLFFLFEKNMVDKYKIYTYASHLQGQHCTAKNSERLADHEHSASSPECAPFRPH